nr:hypothetical protein [Terribacillus saccharophilus]
MRKLLPLPKAKEELKRLQEYIELVETYEAYTLDRKIIKEYALTNSILKVSQSLNIEKDYVRTVLKRRTSDPLHKMIRTGYMTKTKHNRRKY